MARSLCKDPSITQKNDASCIGNKRGMARRAKTQSNKRDRQLLRRDLENEIELETTDTGNATDGSESID